MIPKYVIIDCNPNGEVSLHQCDNADDINAFFKTDETGKELTKDNLLNSETKDKTIWLGQKAGYLIIRGEIITPRPETQVTRWKF